LREDAMNEITKLSRRQFVAASLTAVGRAS
jgi:hypothetical protein